MPNESGITAPIIFVGCSANHEDAESQAVLEYTLAKNALGVQPIIYWMKQTHDTDSPWGGWRTEKWATPFSAFRWAVPLVAKMLYPNADRAIYMDSDFIVMRDISELWYQEFQPGKMVIAKGNGSNRFCCSMWHVDRSIAAFPTLDVMKADPDTHSKLTSWMLGHQETIQPFEPPVDWNAMDFGTLPRDLGSSTIGAIHYTQMHLQVHLKHAVPRLRKLGRRHWFSGQVQDHPRKDLQALFDILLAEAVASGYPLERYCSAPLFGPYQMRGASKSVRASS